MFGISGEHLLILGIVLLIFGPRRLPELGNTLGKGIRNFKDAMSGVEDGRFRRLEEERLQQAQAAPKSPAPPAAGQAPAPVVTPGTTPASTTAAPIPATELAAAEVTAEASVASGAIQDPVTPKTVTTITTELPTPTSSDVASSA